MKQIGFALLFAAAVRGLAPPLAQALTPPGYDFVEAVKKSDGDKATQILSSHPQGIVNTKDGEGNTGADHCDQPQR